MAEARQHAEGMREAGTLVLRTSRKAPPNCSLKAGDLLVSSRIAQGQEHGISYVCPHSSCAAEPKPPSLPCQGHSICMPDPSAGTGWGPWSDLHAMGARLQPGMPLPRGEKASREPNSLYLWITTAAFNSLE